MHAAGVVQMVQQDVPEAEPSPMPSILEEIGGRIRLSERGRQQLRAKCHISRLIAVGGMIHRCVSLEAIVSARLLLHAFVDKSLQTELRKHLAAAEEGSAAAQLAALQQARCILKLLAGPKAQMLMCVDEAVSRSESHVPEELLQEELRLGTAAMANLEQLEGRIEDAGVPTARKRQLLQECAGIAEEIEAVLPPQEEEDDEDVDVSGQLGLAVLSVDSWSGSRAYVELQQLEANAARLALAVARPIMRRSTAD